MRCVPTDGVPRRRLRCAHGLLRVAGCKVSRVVAHAVKAPGLDARGFAALRHASAGNRQHTVQHAIKRATMQRSTAAHRTAKAGWSTRVRERAAVHAARCIAALCRASRNEPERIALRRHRIASHRIASHRIASHRSAHRRALARRVELVGREQRVLPDGAVARRHERRGRGRARKHVPDLSSPKRTTPICTVASPDRRARRSALVQRPTGAGARRCAAPRSRAAWGHARAGGGTCAAA